MRWRRASQLVLIRFSLGQAMVSKSSEPLAPWVKLDLLLIGRVLWYRSCAESASWIVCVSVHSIWPDSARSGGLLAESPVSAVLTTGRVSSAVNLRLSGSASCSDLRAGAVGRAAADSRRFSRKRFSLAAPTRPGGRVTHLCSNSCKFCFIKFYLLQICLENLE